MDFNADRLQFLAGVTGLDDYRTAVLTESNYIGEQDEETAIEVEVEEESPIEDVGEVIPVADAEAALEDLGAALGLDVSVGEVEETEEEEIDVEEETEVNVAEARLRQAIRKELQAILQETNGITDEKQFQHARQTKSVATALGWASGRTRKSPKNRTLSRGPGGSMGFGGPGFM